MEAAIFSPILAGAGVPEPRAQFLLASSALEHLSGPEASYSRLWTAEEQETLDARKMPLY